MKADDRCFIMQSYIVFKSQSAFDILNTLLHLQFVISTFMFKMCVFIDLGGGVKKHKVRLNETSKHRTA